MPSISRNGWRVNYYWSQASGLKLGLTEYRSFPVLHNASVPFVYVNYAGDRFGPFTDMLRSESAKIEVRHIVHGFDLKVSYDSYGADYQYDHVWRFFDDGQFGSSDRHPGTRRRDPRRARLPRPISLRHRHQRRIGGLVPAATRLRALVERRARGAPACRCPRRSRPGA